MAGGLAGEAERAVSASGGVPAREAMVFARYVCGRAASETLRTRYAQAVDALGIEPATPGEARLLALSRRGWPLTGLIDAGCALRHPRGVVRRRLVVMAAVLEASPDHADDFLPAARGRIGQAFEALAALAVAALKAALGVPLVVVVGGRS